MRVNNLSPVAAFERSSYPESISIAYGKKDMKNVSRFVDTTEAA
jgi:hypothetical protein